MEFTFLTDITSSDMVDKIQAPDSRDIVLTCTSVGFFFFLCEFTGFCGLLVRRKSGYMVYSDSFSEEGT